MPIEKVPFPAKNNLVEKRDFLMENQFRAETLGGHFSVKLE